MSKRDMSNKHDYIDAKRRGFIQSSVLVTGAAAAGTASVKASAAELATPDLEAETKQHLGYRETDNVRKYYQKARF